MVEVDAHDPAADADPDAVIAGRGGCRFVVSECGRVVSPGPMPGDRVVWDLCLSPLYGLIPPAAEPPALFQ